MYTRGGGGGGVSGGSCRPRFDNNIQPRLLKIFRYDISRTIIIYRYYCSVNDGQILYIDDYFELLKQRDSIIARFMYDFIIIMNL